MQQPSLTIVELNEFNVELLSAGVNEFDLPHLAEVLSWPRAQTTTADAIEFEGLDPWVQWVNVHTGLPSQTHGALRLGETDLPANRPFWVDACEALDLTWGAWGVMNTPLVDATRCDFFFPDPWSFRENAHPDALNRLLALPRYVSKHYMDLKTAKVLSGALLLLRGLGGNWPATSRFLRTGLRQLMAGHANAHTASTLFDYLGFSLWLDLRRQHQTDVSIIFLNALAHLQHHVWSRDGRWHPEMRLGLEVVDRMLGELLATSEGQDAIVVMNALSQRNVDGDDIHIYRQIRAESILEWLDCRWRSVEPCMTDEINVLFQDSRDADHAERLISGVRLSDGTPAFSTDRISPTQLFYQIAFHHRLSADTCLTCGDQSGPRDIPVSDVIDVHAVRTGSHVPTGDLFARGIEMPAALGNHEVAACLVRHLETVTGRSAQAPAS